MNALMIGVALRLAGRRIRLLRVGVGAAFGAGAAWAARALGHGRTAALWLPVACGMMVIAGGRRTIKGMICDAALLLCAGGLLGGVVLCAHGASGSPAAAYAVCFALGLWLAAMLRGKRALGGRAYIECRAQGETVRFPAIIDTGNTLRDYLTKRPVIVLPESSAQAQRLAAGMPIRPIFADTAGGRQMMCLLVPQETVLVMDGKRKSVRAAIALASALDARSPALMPAALIEGEQDK